MGTQQPVHPHVWSRQSPAASALLRRWVKEWVALKLYTVHCGASRELSCHPGGASTLLAEILAASADGHRAFRGVLRTQGTLEGAGTPCPWLAASAPLWPLGENELHPWQTTETHCRFAVSLARIESPLSSSHVSQGGVRGGRRASCLSEGPQEPRANVCLSCSSLHTQPGFPSLLLCPSQSGLSVLTLYAFLVWQTQHHQHLGTVQSAAAPCGTDAKWLLADGLPADACPADVHPPAASLTSLGIEATSAYCSLLALPTNTDCNSPLMGPSRMSQGSVDRGFRICPRQRDLAAHRGLA